MNIRKNIGYFASAVLIIIGIASLITPIAIGDIFGLTVNQSHPRGWPTLSAVFSGLYLMVGVMFGYGLLNHVDRLELVRWGSYIWTVVALNRIITTIYTGLYTPLNLIFVAMDIFLAAIMLEAAFAPTTPKIKTEHNPLPTVEGQVVSADQVSKSKQS